MFQRKNDLNNFQRVSFNKTKKDFKSHSISYWRSTWSDCGNIPIPAAFQEVKVGKEKSLFRLLKAAHANLKEGQVK